MGALHRHPARTPLRPEMRVRVQTRAPATHPSKPPTVRGEVQGQASPAKTRGLLCRLPRFPANRRGRLSAEGESEASPPRIQRRAFESTTRRITTTSGSSPITLRRIAVVCPRDLTSQVCRRFCRDNWASRVRRTGWVRANQDSANRASGNKDKDSGSKDSDKELLDRECR